MALRSPPQQTQILEGLKQTRLWVFRAFKQACNRPSNSSSQKDLFSSFLAFIQSWRVRDSNSYIEQILQVSEQSLFCSSVQIFSNCKTFWEFQEISLIALYLILLFQNSSLSLNTASLTSRIYFVCLFCQILMDLQESMCKHENLTERCYRGSEWKFKDCWQELLPIIQRLVYIQFYPQLRSAELQMVKLYINDLHRIKRLEKQKYGWELMPDFIIKHQLTDQPFQIPLRLRKKLTLRKNIFELHQPTIRKYASGQVPADQSVHPAPFFMDSALIKSLVLKKIQSYLILVSLLISALNVHRFGSYKTEGEGWETHQIQHTAKYLLWLQTFLTVLLLLVNSISVYFDKLNEQLRGISLSHTTYLLKFGVIAMHPTLWTLSINHLLHLFLTLRLFYLSSYLISASNYHSNRAFRLTEIYGVKPQETFMFALKAIVAQMGIKQIVLVYCLVVLLLSHCLYVAGLGDEQVLEFSSCFEIMVVTLPTIGYGEYHIWDPLQRSIIVISVVLGACLNSLITLIMLSQFRMNSQEENAYQLLNKLNLKTQIEDVSREYIVQIVNQIKAPTHSTAREARLYRTHIDKTFKEEYKYLKSRYTQICTRDINSMFTQFKEELQVFKVGCQQVNNLIFVLLSRLSSLKKVQLLK